MRAQHQRRPPARGRRRHGRAPCARFPASACSTSVRCVPQPIVSSRWPAMPPPSSRRCWRCSSGPSRPSICARTSGEHPRLGAVDVVPFIPIEGVTMAECVALAREGRRRGRRALRAVRSILYEEASTNPARKNLEDIRRGEFEGLAAKMAQPEWAPDFGPAAPASQRRRDGHRRADAAHRLQHQPRDRSARRREEDRRRHPARAAAASASSRRWASRSRTAASSRCR